MGGGPAGRRRCLRSGRPNPKIQRCPLAQNSVRKTEAPVQSTWFSSFRGLLGDSPISGPEALSRNMVSCMVWGPAGNRRCLRSGRPDSKIKRCPYGPKTMYKNYSSNAVNVVFVFVRRGMDGGNPTSGPEALLRNIKYCF